jgi:hypothetical protein
MAGRELVERPPQPGLRQVLERREDRAHLQPDPAGLELREPVRGEGRVLAVAEGELEQEVVVGVDDQRAPAFVTRSTKCRMAPR